MTRRYSPFLFLGTLAFLLLLVFLPEPAPSATAGTTHVLGIRYWSTQSYTRVVIDLDRKPTSYTYRLLKKDTKINKPRRLYVDITRATLDKTLPRAIPINDGLLLKARSGQYNPKTVRVVLDIESIEEYKIFPLEEPYRIVIDVKGEKKPGTGTVALPIPPGEERSGPDSPSLSQQLGLKIRKVVIDPGHGGKDPGAIGRRGTKEKDITLKIAKLVGKKLDGKVDKVILTRDRDVFIPLEERTAIANKNDADLFVSIHINASPRKSASGIETYILNFSKDDEARRVAARENATSTRSVSDLEFILKDLIKTAKTNDSSQLAVTVQDKLLKNLKTRYRDIRSNGVKGAPFYVLVSADMPSILVEVSFISNSRDEKRLRDPKYLEKAAEGISEGIIDFINGSNSYYSCTECPIPSS